jgi:radical SAM protein with 4Fe4S-binding SPASM domain
MTKIEPKDIRVKERQKLEEIIPLKTPFLMFIDPSNFCPFKCNYCPTSDKNLLKKVGRKPAIMSFDLFVKVVDDLKEFDNKIKMINMYSDGEPLANPFFSDMVKYLKDAEVAEKVWTRTNGYYFEPKLNTKLINSGIDLIGISISHVNSEGYKKVSGINLDYDKLVDNIRDLYAKRNNCKIYIKIADSGLTKEEIEKFYDDFTNISDYIGIEYLHDWTGEEGTDFQMGTNPNTFDGLPLVNKVVCPWPFYTLSVKANGHVTVCNEDWKHNINVGNANKESIKDIWNGKKLKDLQIKMLMGGRGEIDVCSNCYYIKCAPDNIDDYRIQLLGKLKDNQCPNF